MIVFEALWRENPTNQRIAAGVYGGLKDHGSAENVSKAKEILDRSNKIFEQDKRMGEVIAVVALGNLLVQEPRPKKD